MSTILCLASYEKGHDFLRQCKQEGWRVVLLTSKSLENSANWPRESIDQVFYIPDKDKEWNMNDVIYGVSFMARTEQIDRIVALDDYDVEKAASLREHLRVPGMGDTAARFFRDKLAMRVQAALAGIAVPEFVHILNYDRVREFLDRVPPPYVLKPRFQAGAIGIEKVTSATQLWELVEHLGDEQSFYVLEQFVPGKVLHVDTIFYEGEVQLAVVNEYHLPPLEVAHEGRVFSTRTTLRGSEEEQELQKLNEKVLSNKGLVQGVSHTEFIKSQQDGKFYFLETSARVGGAHIVELVEAATGLNLWAEWAKIECATGEKKYSLGPHRSDHAGLLNSLSKQEYPDMSTFNAPEIVWIQKKRHHAGLIVSSPNYDRVTELLKEYMDRIYNEFFAKEPPRDRPTD